MANLEELTIETEFEQQSDRWIAEVIELPGVLVYGKSELEAINKAKALALRVLAERLEHGEPTPGIGQIFRLKPTSSTTEALVT
jgi:predicted RNase H-like HicB family nuclease